MPTFRYKAYNSTGKTVSGDIEAHGFKDASERLKKSGLYPVDVKEAGLAGGGLSARLGLSGGVQAPALALATRQLSTLLATGTNLRDALAVLSDNTTNPVLKSIILKVKDRVTEGSSLARALDEHPAVFSQFYRGLVASGEATGSLDKVLGRLADHLETRSKIIKDLKTALAYPALMTFVGGGVLLFLFIFVVPKITRIFEDTETTLPLITRFLIGITWIVRTWWPLLIVIAVFAVWAARKHRGNPRLKAFLDRLILGTPFFGELAMSFYVSTLSRTLGSLLQGGVNLLKSLEITKQATNHTVYDSILDDAVEDCTGGGSLSQSFRKHAEVPPIVVHMVSVGEKGGNLDEMLIKAAEAYEEEFSSNLKRAVSLIEPLMILAMGVVVGFIVLAILLPLFELNQIVR